MYNKSTRQEADDFSEINPHTGLPKHVYFYNHSECNRTALRGVFQMKRKKYHTRTVRYSDDPQNGELSLDEAIAEVVKELKELRAIHGYDDYIKSKGHRKRVKQVYQHESLYPKDQ